jgi:hypothetical protein
LFLLAEDVRWMFKNRWWTLLGVILIAWRATSLMFIADSTSKSVKASAERRDALYGEETYARIEEQKREMERQWTDARADEDNAFGQ